VTDREDWHNGSEWTANFTLSSVTKVMTERRNQSKWRKFKTNFILLLIAGLLLVSYNASTAEKNSNPLSPVRVSADKARLNIGDVTSRLPLRFEPNLGRNNEKVKFFSRGSGYGLFLTASEAVFVLRKNERVSEKKEPLNNDVSVPDSSLRSRH